MEYHRNKVNTARFISAVFTALGVFIVGLFILMLFVFLTTPDSTDPSTAAPFIIFCIVFIIIGVNILNKNRKRHGMLKRSEVYYAQLTANPNCSVDILAAEMHMQSAAVRTDLNNLFNKGYFSGARFNYETGRVEIPGCQQAVNQFYGASSQVVGAESGLRPLHSEMQHVRRAASPNVAEAAAEPVYKTVFCSSCGAMNTVASGTVVECEYCGSPIQG